MKHHRTHHPRYPITLRERLYALFLGPFAVVALLALLFNFLPHQGVEGGALTFSGILLATLYTLARIGAAYALAVVVAIPIALLIEKNRTFESVLLPLFDVLESIPNLAILPVLVVVFGEFGFLNGAAITILFLNMVWSIVFALVGGLQIIPRDVIYAARIFGLSGFSLCAPTRLARDISAIRHRLHPRGGLGVEHHHRRRGAARLHSGRLLERKIFLASAACSFPLPRSGQTRPLPRDFRHDDSRHRALQLLRVADD